MTIICWDGKTLAADKQANCGSMKCTVTKIHRVGNMLVGGSGSLPHVEAMIAWVRGGRRIKAFPVEQKTEADWSPVLVIESDGTPLLYERTPYPVRYEQTHIAIGSGREFARTAMHLGKSAEEAAQVACDLDCYCGNGIDTLELA